VADVADPSAANRLEVNPLPLELAAEFSERPGLMGELDNELVCHALSVQRAAALRQRRSAGQGAPRRESRR